MDHPPDAQDQATPVHALQHARLVHAQELACRRVVGVVPAEPVAVEQLARRHGAVVAVQRERDVRHARDAAGERGEKRWLATRRLVRGMLTRLGWEGVDGRGSGSGTKIFTHHA